MQVHQLQRTTARMKSKRVGRGGKRGKTSGRGTKGQKSRAGNKIRPAVRDMIKKLPKLRGYRFSSIQKKPFPINVAALEQAYNAGETVTVETLVAKKLITNARVAKNGIKILGNGELTKKLTISGLAVSESAKTKITQAGGSIDA